MKEDWPANSCAYVQQVCDLTASEFVYNLHIAYFCVLVITPVFVCEYQHILP